MRCLGGFDTRETGDSSGKTITGLELTDTETPGTA
jgi:hypothetical protein